MENSKNGDERLYGLDLLKGVAMLFGVVYHAPAIFLYDAPWSNTLEFLGVSARPRPEIEYSTWIVCWFTHLWRMPLFFILAGFFAAMIIERKGVAHFAQDRALRVTATLFVFMAIFAIALNRDLGEFNHLWFLWQLTLLSSATVIWNMFGMAPMAALSSKHLVLLLPLVMLMAWIFREDQLRQPLALHILDPLNLSVLIYYTPFYLIGMGIWRARETIKVLAETRWVIIWLGLGIAGTTIILTDPNNILPDVLRAVASGMATLGMSFGLIGLVQRLVTRRHAGVAWLAQVSYPIYVFHFYPTLLVAVWLQLWGLPQGIVVFGAVLGGLIASLMQWYAFVCWTPLDVLMNGPAKARFLIWWRARKPC